MGSLPMSKYEEKIYHLMNETIFRITLFENLGHLNKTVDTFELDEVMKSLDYSNWIFLNNLGKVSISQLYYRV